LLLLFQGSAHGTHGANQALADDPSPYLRLHARDPIHWRRWEASTIEEARRTGKLLFVSIGYFSCHWCHVMQRESFSSNRIAEALNAGFIPVKIDRELEPALDDYLNTFVQAARGYSGWPLNVFLTPDGNPLVGAVYMPPEQFHLLLSRITSAWKDTRAELEKGAAEAAAYLQSADREVVAITLDRPHVERVLAEFVRQARSAADERGGGFGVTSKFPSVPQLRALLIAQGAMQDPELAPFLELTLDRMAGRGLRDHLAGGFFRYTTDPEWLKPHFEKMLYDNALLADLYLRAAEALGDPALADVAYDTLDFMLAELERDGAFDASLSAVDDKDVEGGYYLWDPATLERVLDADELRVAGPAWRLEGTPPFEHGYLPIAGADLDAVAAELAMDRQRVDALLAAAGKNLAAERRTRTLPRDDKQLTAWNGMALAALARASARPDGARYLEAARRLRDVIATELWTGSVLLRARGGGGEGSLQDYAYGAEGLLAFARVSGSKEDYELVRAVIVDGWRRFHTDDGWRRTESPLIPMLRPAPAISDGPTPSASATMLGVTLETAAFLGDDGLRERAETAMGRTGQGLAAQPFYFASHVAVLLTFVR
jgi:uncharacterized protein YyaL (SSP411 family)